MWPLREPDGRGCQYARPASALPPAPARVPKGAPPAPMTSGAPPEPEPAPVIFPSHEEESIFTPPAQDDLFGDANPPATIEMPPEAGWSAHPAPSRPEPVFHD